MNGTPWTAEQLELLRRIYPDTPTRDVAKACKHSLHSAYQYAQRLGLKKSQAFLDSPASGRMRHHLYRGQATRFKKGQAPPNKGLRRPGWGPGRMKETQFKKGQVSHTWRPIGTEIERKDGYIWVKVANGLKPNQRNWKSKHQAIYEAAHGPIPPKHMVTFKDRDRRNFSLENLEQISKRDNALRNGIHRYPPELVRVIQLRGALQRQINKRQPPPKARIGRPPKRPRNTASA